MLEIGQLQNELFCSRSKAVARERGRTRSFDRLRMTPLEKGYATPLFSLENKGFSCKIPGCVFFLLTFDYLK